MSGTNDGWGGVYGCVCAGVVERGTMWRERDMTNGRGDDESI